MALYLFILLLVVLERVHTSPFPEGQKRRDNDILKRLGDIKEKLRLAHDEGEYKRYREELAMNDPNFARKMNREGAPRGPHNPNINPEDLARGPRNPNINPEDLARGPRDRNGARSQLEELQRLNIEEIKQLHRQQATGNRPPIHGLGKEPPNMGGFRNGRMDQDELNRKLEEHRRVQVQIDEARKEQFKRHEMQMEHLRRQKLKEMDEAQRLREEARIQQQNANSKEHDRVIHPGSRKQLEEIWKNQDGLADEKFDARTFFYLHDINGDSVLDPYEVESLFMTEVRKVYGDNSDEMMMKEELSEMREHVVNEIDKNRDDLISLDEFLQYSNMRIFDIDEEWQPLKDKDVFSDEEIDRFEKYYDDYKYDDYDEMDRQQEDGHQGNDGEHKDGGQQEDGGHQVDGGQQEQKDGGQQVDDGQQEQKDGGHQVDGGQQEQKDGGQQVDGGQEQKDGGQQENHEAIVQKDEPEGNNGQL